MKVEGQAPTWAIELIEQVCKDYNRGKPGLLEWKTHYSSHASGYTQYTKRKSKAQVTERVKLKNGKYKTRPFRGKILLRGGVNEKDNKLVLLHELAHWINNRSGKQGHTTRFWKLAFELYERYDVDIEYAYSRERWYKVKAGEIYKKHFAPTEALVPASAKDK